MSKSMEEIFNDFVADTLTSEEENDKEDEDQNLNEETGED